MTLSTCGHCKPCRHSGVELSSSGVTFNSSCNRLPHYPGSIRQLSQQQIQFWRHDINAHCVQNLCNSLNRTHLWVRQRPCLYTAHKLGREVQAFLNFNWRQGSLVLAGPGKLCSAHFVLPPPTHLLSLFEHAIWFLSFDLFPRRLWMYLHLGVKALSHRTST